MWPALRIGAVLVVAATWVVVGSYTLISLGVGAATFPAEQGFGSALGAAQIDAWKGDPSAPLPSVCGFPVVEAGHSYSLSHSQVVEIARCLHRDGYLSAAGLTDVESSRFGMSWSCPADSAVKDTASGAIQNQTMCLIAYDRAQSRGHSWLPTALVLAGLPLVVWLVGFRLPWPAGRTNASSSL